MQNHRAYEVVAYRRPGRFVQFSADDAQRRWRRKALPAQLSPTRTRADAGLVSAETPGAIACSAHRRAGRPRLPVGETEQDPISASQGLRESTGRQRHSVDPVPRVA